MFFLGGSKWLFSFLCCSTWAWFHWGERVEKISLVSSNGDKRVTKRPRRPCRPLTSFLSFLFNSSQSLVSCYDRQIFTDPPSMPVYVSFPGLVIEKEGEKEKECGVCMWNGGNGKELGFLPCHSFVGSGCCCGVPYFLSEHAHSCTQRTTKGETSNFTQLRASYPM